MESLRMALPVTLLPRHPSFLFLLLGLYIPHQAGMTTCLPQVYWPGYPLPDLLALARACLLCQNDVRKDKGSLEVPSPVANTSPFCRQEHGEPPANDPRQRGIPASASTVSKWYRRPLPYLGAYHRFGGGYHHTPPPAIHMHAMW